MQFEINQEIVKLAESITEEQRKEMRSLQNMAPTKSLMLPGMPMPSL